MAGPVHWYCRARVPRKRGIISLALLEAGQFSHVLQGKRAPYGSDLIIKIPILIPRRNE